MASKSPRRKSPAKQPIVILHHNDLPHVILGRPPLTTVTKTFPVGEEDAQGNLVHIGYLDLEWTYPTTSPDGSLTGLYRGRLTFRPLTGSAVREVLVSAYNIGLQGRRTRITVHAVSAGVRFWDPHQPDGHGGLGDWYPRPVNVQNPLHMPRTNGSNSNVPPVAANIWGLAFMGPTGEIWVSSRKRVHNPMLHMLESHDTSPPPDEPGGDDGEE